MEKTADEEIKNSIQIKQLEDQFKNLEEIGKGCFGVVYRCQKIDDRERPNSIYALKSIQQSKDEYQSKAIRREINILQQLKNLPGVVRLYDVFEDTQNYYLCLEYLRSGSLQDKLESLKKDNQFLTNQELQSACRQLLQGLCGIHENGCCHRDLQPDNIMLDEDRWVIVDLGNARQTDEGLANTEVGNILYKAPEVIERQDIDQNYDTLISDTFSMAMILFEIAELETAFKIKKQLTFYQIQIDLIRQKKSGPIFSDATKARRPESFLDLLTKMLDPSLNRLTCVQALDHPFFSEDFNSLNNSILQSSFQAMQVGQFVYDPKQINTFISDNSYYYLAYESGFPEKQKIMLKIPIPQDESDDNFKISNGFIQTIKALQSDGIQDPFEYQTIKTQSNILVFFPHFPISLNDSSFVKEKPSYSLFYQCDLLDILGQTVDLLDIYKSKKQYHGFISPQTIKVNQNREVHLAHYYGISEELWKQQRNECLKDVFESKFMAPEVLQLQSPNEKSDLFSLAVTFYYLIFKIFPDLNQISKPSNYGGIDKFLKDFFTKSLKNDYDQRKLKISDLVNLNFKGKAETKRKQLIFEQRARLPIDPDIKDENQEEKNLRLSRYVISIKNIVRNSIFFLNQFGTYILKYEKILKLNLAVSDSILNRTIFAIFMKQQLLFINELRIIQDDLQVQEDLLLQNYQQKLAADYEEFRKSWSEKWKSHFREYLTQLSQSCVFMQNIVKQCDVFLSILNNKDPGTRNAFDAEFGKIVRDFLAKLNDNFITKSTLCQINGTHVFLAQEEKDHIDDMDNDDNQEIGSPGQRQESGEIQYQKRARAMTKEMYRLIIFGCYAMEGQRVFDTIRIPSLYSQSNIQYQIDCSILLKEMYTQDVKDLYKFAIQKYTQYK